MTGINNNNKYVSQAPKTYEVKYVEVKTAGFGISVGEQTGISTPFGEAKVDPIMCYSVTKLLIKNALSENTAIHFFPFASYNNEFESLE